jgi:hypothetical protein
MVVGDGRRWQRLGLFGYLFFFLCGNNESNKLSGIDVALEKFYLPQL